MCIPGITNQRLVSDLMEMGLISPEINPSSLNLLPESSANIPIPEIEALKQPTIIDSMINGSLHSGNDRVTDPDERVHPASDSKPTGYEIADIFRLYGAEIRANNHLTVDQYKVMNAIENCRTGNFGFHVDICDKCGTIDIGANSCRNGHCPKCQSNKRFAWVEARIDDMLPVPYYHAVFTLPDGIYPMCLYNRKVIYDILIRSSAQTLKKFGSDPRWLGADIGFFGILHTWGQLLNVHLHVHWIVPAGGIDKDGNWVEPKFEKNNFLFPVQAMTVVYRGIFVENLKKAYADGELEFPGELAYLENDYDFNNWINQQVSKKWVVYAKKPFESPERVIAYIGRYTHRVAISNSRILSIDNGVIRFSYKNYKKQKTAKHYKELWEETELPADEFIRRFLHHVLPRGYHRIRHYGFLSNGCKKKFHDIRNRLLEGLDADLLEKPEPRPGRKCPVCETGTMISVLITDGYGKILKGSRSELLALKQQINAGDDTGNQPFINDSS